MWQRFVALLDWVARVHFIVTFGIGALGGAVTFILTAIDGWDAATVWLASVTAGGVSAVIYIAVRLWLEGRQAKSPS